MTRNKAGTATLREHLSSPHVFGRVRVAHLFSFCVVLLCVFTLRVPCCDVCYDFHITRGSKEPVIAHLVFTLTPKIDRKWGYYT
jgi:hypothetical protein